MEFMNGRNMLSHCAVHMIKNEGIDSWIRDLFECQKR